MTENLDIGKLIKERRKQLHITQDTLAELSGLSVNYLSKLENGSRQNISVDTLLKLAQAFGTTASDFLAGTNSKSSLESTLTSHERLLINKLNEISPDKRNVLAQRMLDIIELLTK